MRSFLILLSLLAVSAISKVDDTNEDEEWKEKPIQKVVRLLKEMQAQVQKEADEDEDIYEKLGCWCDTNEKEKSKASAINTQSIADLGAAIEEFTAKSAQLKTDIENLKAQVEQQENSLAESTSLREKEAGEFHAYEKDAVQNIASVKTAVQRLEKVQPSSLIVVKQLLRRHFQKNRQMLAEMLSPKQHKLVLSLIQQPEDVESADALLQQSGEYAPQSGAIFGILKQMKESFETNLVTSQKEESQAKDDFASMKESKSQEIASANELIDSKTVELADTDEKLASSKSDLADTQATLDADTEFLANLKKKCTNAEAEYTARQKVRMEEISAIGEALGILTDDDAKDQLLKFVQVSSNTARKAKTSSRERAARFVQQAAKRLHRPQLAALSVSMRADVFAKVKENIDAMVTALKKEQADEVKTKDFCNKEFHQNEMQSAEKANQKEDLTTLIADLEMSKTTLAEEIASLKEEVKQTYSEMKQASELRVKQNAEFQMTVTDQQASQKIIAKALDKLNAFYAKKSFLQKRSSHKQPGYKKNAGAASIMTMMENCIEESKELEKEALAAENEASAAYQTYMADSNAAIEAMSKDMINKQEELEESTGRRP